MMQHKLAVTSAGGWSSKSRQAKQANQNNTAKQTKGRGGGQRTTAREKRDETGPEQKHKNSTSTKRSQTKKHQGAQRGLDTQKEHPRKGETSSWAPNCHSTFPSTFRCALNKGLIPCSLRLRIPSNPPLCLDQQGITSRWLIWKHTSSTWVIRFVFQCRGNFFSLCSKVLYPKHRSTF